MRLIGKKALARIEAAAYNRGRNDLNDQIARGNCRTRHRILMEFNNSQGEPVFTVQDPHPATDDCKDWVKIEKPLRYPE